MIKLATNGYKPEPDEFDIKPTDEQAEAGEDWLLKCRWPDPVRLRTLGQMCGSKGSNFFAIVDVVELLVYEIPYAWEGIGNNDGNEIVMTQDSLRALYVQREDILSRLQDIIFERIAAMEAKKKSSEDT